MKRLFYSVLLLFIGITLNLQAQVVIGDAVAPQSFSALEIISNGTGGLRLPQLTNVQRAAVQTAIEALAPAEQYKALGLMIFNLNTDCVETWNGTEWKRNCASADLGSIGSLDCSGAAVTVISGAAVNAVKTLTYSDLTGIVSVTDGQELGTEGSLTVIANGDQDLTDPSGSISIKITGTAPAAGTSIPVALAGADCSIAVTMSDPETIPAGTGSLLGRTCFDIALSNNNTTCGTLAGRTAQQANFNLPATNTQTYTFIPTGSVSDIRFYFVETNGEGLIVQSLTADGDYSGDATAGNSYTATLIYKSGLNTSALGKTSTNALTVDIYVIYNNAAIGGEGVDRTVKLTASIKDCACCGAFVSAGVFKVFMCHNLGADETRDPFQPHKDLHGAFFKFGVKAPAMTAAENTNASFDAWSNAAQWASRGGTPPNDHSPWQPANDPCPAGFRVPTRAELDGVANNALNPRTPSGSWTHGVGNWTSGMMYGPSLFLPASGSRSTDGALVGRGNHGAYWSRTPNTNTSLTYPYPYYIYTHSGGGGTSGSGPAYGYSVRCIQE